MAGEIETIIRYDGPALAGHDMDVEALAPALLALASLIQTANHKFNGDRSAVRVVVNANLEQQCFQIKIKLVQDLLGMARDFLGGDDMVTIKEICDWIGIVVSTSAGGYTVLKLLLALGKKQQDATILNATANDDSTVLQVGTIQELHLHLPEGTPPQVRELLADPVIVAKAKEVLKPVTEPGYETVSFIEPKSGRKVFEATKGEVKAALTYAPPEIVSAPDPEDGVPTPIRTVVFVKTQQNEGTADWALKWTARAVSASMDDLPWLERFQNGQVPHDLPLYLDVDMEMITSRTNPDAPARYRVTKVHGVVPNGRGKQTGMFDGEPA